MRYVDLAAVVATIDADVLANLEEITLSMDALPDVEKAELAANGNPQWRPVKQFLEAASSRKCWYTESKNPGCHNDVEHFRPKGKILDQQGNLVHWYWFLAFKPSNYRLSCVFSNRKNVNSLLGKTGGKGDDFPLLDNMPHAVNVAELVRERPALLDPCSPDDVRLLAFNPDGRPVVSPAYAGDAEARLRVEKSNLLLNLDFPTFNEDREELYNKVVRLVERGDRYAAEANPALDDVKIDLRELMAPVAEYSMAAVCYIRGFRDRDWIRELFV